PMKRNSRYPKGQEPSMELLRLRDVLTWIQGMLDPFPRDAVEGLEAAGVIHPFRKHKRAKALYRKWEFKKAIEQAFEVELPRNVNLNSEPHDELLRLADVTTWLGVTKAEVA